MSLLYRTCHLGLLMCCILVAGNAPAAQEPFVPKEGLAGKDAVWVPTPQIVVEIMLDVAKVTPDDYVIDLGSGDGRSVIAAARRGARALGVEYNPDLVEFSKRAAASQGVADKALFVQGDMFAADISQATVMPLFLLPENLVRLTPKFLALKPGTRIVANTFGISGWDPDEVTRVSDNCVMWCTAMLYIVPATVPGVWRLSDGEIVFEQKFQMLAGNLHRAGAMFAISNGRLRGDEISFTVDGTTYLGRIDGDTMSGNAKGRINGPWSAARVRP